MELYYSAFRVPVGAIAVLPLKPLAPDIALGSLKIHFPVYFRPAF